MVTLQPTRLSWRMILCLMPQSTATTSYLWLGTRDIQRFLQLTRETISCGRQYPASLRIASSRGVAASVTMTFWLPSLRIMRVSVRVSTPQIAGMPYSSNTSFRVFVYRKFDGESLYSRTIIPPMVGFFVS